MTENNNSNESGRVYSDLRKETDIFVENINKLLRGTNTFAMIEASIVHGRVHVSKVRVDEKHS